MPRVWVWSPPQREPYLTVFCDRCGCIRRFGFPLPLNGIGDLAKEVEAQHAKCVQGPILLCHKCLCFHEGACPELPR